MEVQELEWKKKCKTKCLLAQVVLLQKNNRSLHHACMDVIDTLPFLITLPQFSTIWSQTDDVGSRYDNSNPSRSIDTLNIYMRTTVNSFSQRCKANVYIFLSCDSRDNKLITFSRGVCHSHLEQVSELNPIVKR